MSTPVRDKVQISVRLDRRVAELLDARVAQARRGGHRIAKEQLVSDAITAAYGDQRRRGWLPAHQGSWNPHVDPASTTALLDWLDEATP